MNYDSFDRTGRAKKLWEITDERIKTLLTGNIPERGLALVGTQGSGKSSAMWMLARAAIRGLYDTHEQYTDRKYVHPNSEKLIPNPVPVFCGIFPLLLRSITPTKDDPYWKIDTAMDIARDNRLVFLDDLTFNPNAANYQWIIDFVSLLLTVLENRTPGSFMFCFTSNNKRGELESIIGPQMVDRILGMCDVVKCEWPSYRTNQKAINERQ